MTWELHAVLHGRGMQVVASGPLLGTRASAASGHQPDDQDGVRPSLLARFLVDCASMTSYPGGGAVGGAAGREGPVSNHRTRLREAARGVYRGMVLGDAHKGHGQGRLRNYMQRQYDLMSDVKPWEPRVAAFGQLPPYSFLVSFTFTLRKPYLSRDDQALYIIDNPVKKDKVFRVPMIAASTWKGSLRSVFALASPGDDQPGAGSGAAPPDSEALFGCLRGSDGGRQGRLFFFPTFFNDIGLEVINPRSRTDRAGTRAIDLECVPAGARGEFRLLYVPFDLVGRDKEARTAALADAAHVVTAMIGLMTVYGFGAKTSSGRGVVEERVQSGRFLLSALNGEGGLRARRAPLQRTFGALSDMVHIAATLPSATTGHEGVPAC